MNKYVALLCTCWLAMGLVGKYDANKELRAAKVICGLMNYRLSILIPVLKEDIGTRQEDFKLLEFIHTKLQLDNDKGIYDTALSFNELEKKGSFLLSVIGIVNQKIKRYESKFARQMHDIQENSKQLRKKISTLELYYSLYPVRPHKRSWYLIY